MLLGVSLALQRRNLPEMETSLEEAGQGMESNRFLIRGFSSVQFSRSVVSDSL